MAFVVRFRAAIIACGLIALMPAVTCGGARMVAERVTDRGDNELNERQDEIDRLRRLVAEIQPEVAELTGFPEGEPVAVAVMTREDLREYIIWSMEMGYPGDELYRRGRCLSMIGLLPEDYDLESGMIDLVGEQAAGLYDPYGKAFNGIVGLSPRLRAPQYQSLIASHELTHALQDRMIDILAHAKVALSDIDYEYGLRAALEGIATVVMLAYTQKLAVDDTPDARSFMRTSFEHTSRDPAMNATARTPEYLRELLISPYAEGGAFVQAWHRANPDLALADLMRNIPATSEQVLHPEKYMEPDVPTVIDLEAVGEGLPEGWESFYSNTLGEFDLLTLFSLYGETAAEAAEMAAGWDGLRFSAFRNRDEHLMLVGSSVWDSELDAKEFHAGFSTVLLGIGDPGSFTIVHDGRCVDFIIGSLDRNVTESLLADMLGARRNDRQAD
jgi:hypothetical protein